MKALRGPGSHKDGRWGTAVAVAVTTWSALLIVKLVSLSSWVTGRRRRDEPASPKDELPANGGPAALASSPPVTEPVGETDSGTSVDSMLTSAEAALDAAEAALAAEAAPGASAKEEIAVAKALAAAEATLAAAEVPAAGDAPADSESKAGGDTETPPETRAIAESETAAEVDTEPPQAAATRAARLWLGRATPTFVLTAGFTIAVCSSHLLAARAFGVAFLLVIPGTVTLAAIRLRQPSGSLRVASGVAGSVSAIMTIGLLASILLPHIGISRPLDRWPMVIAVDAFVVVATALAARRVDPVAWLLGDTRLRLRGIAAGLGLVALPVVAVAGATLLNNGGSSWLAVTALVGGGTVLIGGVIAGSRPPEWWGAGSLFAVSLAFAYSLSQRSNYLFGSDIQQEYQAFSTTATAGAWHIPPHGDAYRAMLSITALPVALAHMSGVSGIELFKTVYPMFLALFPVVVFVVGSRLITRPAAFAAASALVLVPSFAQELPALARQEVALLIFGVLVALAFDQGIPVRTRQGLVVATAAALAVSHYTTAYIAAGTIGLAFVGYTLWRLVRPEVRRRAVLSLPVVIGVFICIVGWNAGITRSAGNVLAFANQASTTGAEVLPNGASGSVVNRWLNGNVTASISAATYYREVAAVDRVTKPWINPLPPAITGAYPVVSATAARDPSRVAGFAAVLRVATSLASQLVLLATALGVLLLALRYRRDRSQSLEFAFVGLAFLGFLVFMRLSGTAVADYNPERAQIQSWVVTGIGLAAVLAFLTTHFRRLSVVLVAIVLGVMFVGSSGIGVLIGGGSPSAALSNGGESYDRFYVAGPEVAAAKWLAAQKEPKALIWSDKYGELVLEFGGAAHPVPQTDLTPATIDRNSYVFATTANVAGRARGSLDSAREQAVYQFPAPFLNAYKDLIYSTATSRVYR